MSHTLPPPESGRTHDKSQSSSFNLLPASLSILSARSDAYVPCSIPSSLPLYSSSPPENPCSGKGGTHEYNPLPLRETQSGYNLEVLSHFRKSDHSPKSLSFCETLPCPKSTCTDNRPQRPSTPFGPLGSSLLSESALQACGGTPERYYPVFYESEDEERDPEEDSDGYSFPENQTLSFQTSAERWMWRHDLGIETHSRHRQSASASSPYPIPGVNHKKRPGSEPASSTVGLPVFSHRQFTSIGTSNPSTPLPDTVLVSSPLCNASLPSLTSDRESSEPDHVPLSPLPPSSPPMSPYSAFSSPLIRPISSNSYIEPPPEATFPRLDHHAQPMKSEGAKYSNESISPRKTSSDNPTTIRKVEFPPNPDRKSTISESSSLLLGPCCPTNSSFISAKNSSIGETNSLQIMLSQEPVFSTNRSAVLDSLQETKNVTPIVEGALSAGNPVRGVSFPAKGKEKARNEEIFGKPPISVPQNSGTKRKRAEDVRKNGRLKKARPTETILDTQLNRTQTKNKDRIKRTGRADAVVNTALPAEQAKEVKHLKEQSQLQHFQPHTDTQPSKNRLLTHREKENTSPYPDQPSEPIDDKSREIRGMLIECMATSRASSLPLSVLYKSVMECRPALKAERSEQEWLVLFERVLRSEEAVRGGSGVFGRVESSFKCGSSAALDAQWFYVPEFDEDQERATLLRTMMPRLGKRSETKKFKQYYYRPLEKISKWGTEDEL